MKYLIIFLLFITACAEDNVSNTNNNQNNNVITDEIINTINNEVVVIYQIGNKITQDNIIKEKQYKLTSKFINPRNEDINILIPESDDYRLHNVTILLDQNQNNMNKCKKGSECVITYNMIIGEQSDLKNPFSFYMPITLLNDNEFKIFLELNKDNKYKNTAMKYLQHRIYIKDIINGSFKK